MSFPPAAVSASSVSVAGQRRRQLLETLLALSAPLLIVLALVLLLQRQGRERMQVLPALAIGIALGASSRVSRGRRRRALLQALRQSGPPAPGS
jgi:flagellar biogenesis protein FliO